jgi:SpoVK/Ycf46/Vps4 family AAA+-type ATPase
MKRPGRFDRQLFIPPPDAEARAAMLEAKLRDVPCERIDFVKIARKAAHFSGADIDGLIEHAKESTIYDIVESGQERPVTEQDLMRALQELSPTTLEWLKSARNLVKFGGGARAYKDMEAYLRAENLY